MNFPFQNPDLPLNERTEDLLSRLSLPEKISQMMHDSPAIERLGIPAYNWWNEACHGIGRCGRATVFPQVIGLAATWNRDLLHKIATAISDEARAKHHAAIAAGRHGQYQGLTFWTPNINIFRDPRWGRGQETFGEDPFLTGELGATMVRGLQGTDDRYLKTAACAKHFAVHSGPEDERHSFDAKPTPKDLYETYLPAFEKLVGVGVESVMGAYNRVYGEPACGSRFLLEETLRGRWQFKGHVVSDCMALDDFHLYHHVTKDAAESAALALENGCDLNCGCTYNDLLVAVKQNLVAEAKVDLALRRLLATKFRLGLFDPPSRVPFSAIPISVVDGAEHRKLAWQAAAESVVLLKNAAKTLPLAPDVKSLFVTGPSAAGVGALVGNYHGLSAKLVTLVEGLVERVSDVTGVEYRQGCAMGQEIAPAVNYALSASKDAEVTIAVMGFDNTLEGEEGDAVCSPHGGDRPRIELPEVQRAYLRELRKNAKKLILVLTGGSALAIPEELEFCDAVLQVWYPGCEGGRAVAAVLFGDVSPSGRLPVTVPRRTEDLPPFNDYSMHGRTYRFAEVEPLFPFGFGLSYASYRYKALEVARTRLAAGESAVIRTEIVNTNGVNGLETVQCYVIPPQDRKEAPKAVLVGFQKVSVPAGGKTTVTFDLPESAFQQVDEAGRRVRMPGRYRVVVGPASPGPRAVALGAPESVDAEVFLT